MLLKFRTLDSVVWSVSLHTIRVIQMVHCGPHVTILAPTIAYKWAAPESFALGKFDTKSGTCSEMKSTSRYLEFWCNVVGIIQSWSVSIYGHDQPRSSGESE